MIVCFVWRIVSSWSFVVSTALDRVVSNAKQPEDLPLTSWSAFWYISPLLDTLSMVLNTFIKVTEIDHDWKDLLSVLWKYIPPLGLESMILILWNTGKHAHESIKVDRSIVLIDRGNCVHFDLRCCKVGSRSRPALLLIIFWFARMFLSIHQTHTHKRLDRLQSHRLSWGSIDEWQ